MRYLAWLLLLANLGMLAWIFTQSEPQVSQSRPSSVLPGIEPLVLLSERETEFGIARVPVQQEPPIQESTPQESPTPAAPSAPITSPADPPVEAPAAPEPVCWTAGPLPAEADAGALRTQLLAQGFRARLRTEKSREPKDYWVYIPAMPAAAARRIVADLDAHGLSDHYVGNGNYISLGIFSGKGKAQQHLDHIRTLGFDAVLDQRYRTLNVHWLDVAEGSVPLLTSPVWADVLARYPAIDAQRVPCE